MSSCHLCLNTASTWSVGKCDHPVCHVCSSRMRVLCRRRECALCRTDLDKVVFTNHQATFRELENNVYQMDRKHNICFETEEIQAQYRSLLAQQCPVCGVICKTFAELGRHVRREHRQNYCDLCHDNLDLFTGEKTLYSRTGLATHRRQEHPECRFCRTRHYDEEKLYQHCRTEHFLCQICEKDGVQNFYAEYSDLWRHFTEDHYVCRDPACEEQKFVVFRDEIDLKAHQVAEHGAKYKSDRSLNLPFRRGHMGDVEDARPSEKLPDFVKDFPQIEGSDNQPVFSLTSWSNKGNKLAGLNDEEFPSLLGARLKCKSKR